MARIYLDNAATSFPKPEPVYAAMDDYSRNLGVAAGRSGSHSSLKLQATIDRCRKLAASLLGAESPDRIAFTANCTDSLNQAIHGILKPNDHVVISSVEHNSVVRPLRTLTDRGGVRVTEVQGDAEGVCAPDDFRRAIESGTRLVVVTHASNVTGAIQPVEQIAAIARDAGALILVDAAQTAGHVPIDVSGCGVHLLATAGHKGLMGPLGTGLLYVRPDIDEMLCSTRQGGTGTRSESVQQPGEMPHKLESGNQNAPGLCGLMAGLNWVTEQTVKTIHQTIGERIGELIDGLSSIEGAEVFAAPPSSNAGVVSLKVPGLDPQDLSMLLEQTAGVECRSGFHCAPDAHRTIGTLTSGGTTRLSPGPFTTRDEIAVCVDAIRELIAS